MSVISSLAIFQSAVTEQTYSKVTKLVAVVAAAVSATVKAQCGTVSLDVANSLAVVALLG